MRYPDYPFASNYATIDGLRLHYLDEGERQAPPLVMVHGNPTWSFFFRKPVLALRDRWRCIVPDHIGMGLSDRPGRDDYGFTLADRIDDLEKLLEQLGVIKNVTLMLHDWGGMIGMGYACRHPERIHSLIFMNTAAFHLPRGLGLPWQLRLARGPLGPLLVRGLNDTAPALRDIAAMLGEIRPDEVHINLPTRPPAETWVQLPDEEGLMRARAILGNIAHVVHPAQGTFDLSGCHNLTEAIVFGARLLRVIPTRRTVCSLLQAIASLTIREVSLLSRSQSL